MYVLIIMWVMGISTGVFASGSSLILIEQEPFHQQNSSTASPTSVAVVRNSPLQVEDEECQTPRKRQKSSLKYKSFEGLESFARCLDKIERFIERGEKADEVCVVVDVDVTLTNDPNPPFEDDEVAQPHSEFNTFRDQLLQLIPLGVGIVISSACSDFERTRKTLKDLGLYDQFSEGPVGRQILSEEDYDVQRQGSIISVRKKTSETRLYIDKFFAALEHNPRARHFFLVEDSDYNIERFKGICELREGIVSLTTVRVESSEE